MASFASHTCKRFESTSRELSCANSGKQWRPSTYRKLLLPHTSGKSAMSCRIAENRRCRFSDRNATLSFVTYFFTIAILIFGNSTVSVQVNENAKQLIYSSSELQVRNENEQALDKLKAGLNKPEALRRAQSTLRNEASMQYAHPYY